MPIQSSLASMSSNAFGFKKGLPLITNTKDMYDWLANPGNSQVKFQNQVDGSTLIWPIQRNVGSLGSLYLGTFNIAGTSYQADSTYIIDVPIPIETYNKVKYTAALFTHQGGVTYPKFLINGVQGQSEKGFDEYWINSFLNFPYNPSKTTTNTGTATNPNVYGIESVPATIGTTFEEAYFCDSRNNGGPGFIAGAVDLYIGW